MQGTVLARCSRCRFPRGPQDIGPCPRCGNVGRDLVGVVNETLEIREQRRWAQERDFVRNHRGYHLLNLLVIIVVPTLGNFLGQSIGLILGIMISLLAYVLIPPAVIRIRERTRGT